MMKERIKNRIKEKIKQSKDMSEERTDKKSFQNLHRTGWWWGVLLGIAFLAAGGYLNQFEDIFIKATRICLECIGIG